MYFCIREVDCGRDDVVVSIARLALDVDKSFEDIAEAGKSDTPSTSVYREKIFQVRYQISSV